MNPVPEHILKFIGEHHVLTLAVSTDTGPWCATCFYVYVEAVNLFIFTSDDDTIHISEVLKRQDFMVAGAIALETKMVGKIRGIQFSGPMKRLEGGALKLAKKAYLGAFPVARLAPLTLWGVTPEVLKMTDNRLGFGKKLTWKIDK